MNIVCFDTETTGLSPLGGDEILQLSIIDGDGKTLYDGYFRPQQNESWPTAEQVNHISPAMVADCPTFAEKRDKIQAIFDSADRIIGYNTQFDMRFLGAQGIDFSRFKDGQIVDVMADFAPIYGEWDEKRNDYKWQKLTICAEHYGFDWSAVPAHNSLGDCLATLHCYKAMQRKYEPIKGAWYMNNHGGGPADKILIQRQDDTLAWFPIGIGHKVSESELHPVSSALELDVYLKAVHADEMCKRHDFWGKMQAACLHSWGFEKEGWALEQAAPERESRDDYER